MDEDALRWLEEHGIEVDEEGVPKAVGFPGLGRCSLCGAMAESPIMGLLYARNRDFCVWLCTDCWRLKFTDIQAYWDKVEDWIDRYDQLHGDDQGGTVW